MGVLSVAVQRNQLVQVCRGKKAEDEFRNRHRRKKGTKTPHMDATALLTPYRKVSLKPPPRATGSRWRIPHTQPRARRQEGGEREKWEANTSICLGPTQ